MRKQARQHPGVEALLREVADLRHRLEDAEQTVRAIREDEVDAFVVNRGQSDRVLTLEPASHPYRRYVEVMRQAAVTLSSDGIILYANQAFAQLVLQPLATVVGSSINDFLAASSRPILKEVLARQPDGRGEALLERGDGVVVPVHLTASQSADEPEIVCLVITDLTDQRRLEEMTAAEQLSRSILEQAVDAIVVGGRSGRLIRAGAAARRLCGMDPIGLSFDAAFPLRPRLEAPGRSALPSASSWIERTLAGETIRGVEARLEREDGQCFELLVSSGPLTDAKGIVVGFVATLTDITRLRGAEESLREADRRKDEFLAMLAHELRNPLSAIGNAVKVARETPDEADTRTWSIDVIERQAQQLGRLVDDLLDISRISQGKVRLRKQLVDIRSIIDRAVESVRPQLAEKQHELAIDAQRGPLPVEADPSRLEQILVNLLSNAARYTDPGGHVRISAAREDGELVVHVSDTGIGIDPEKLPQVFELFEQLDHSMARSRGGLGIGLTLVRRLAELHCGSVSASSPGRGQGATFTVRLPLAAPGASVGAASEDPPPPAKTETRILIVDDNVDSATGLAKLLQRQGYTVETAYDGPGALEAAARSRPGFVLLDIALPGMDGYQVAERLRELLGEHLVICAVSGYGREQDRQKAREAGFDHHLMKPLDFDRLLAVLAEAAPERPRGK